jgi:hypothetical protein
VKRFTAAVMINPKLTDKDRASTDHFNKILTLEAGRTSLNEIMNKKGKLK